MSSVLIVEDGTEYLEFFQLFLAQEHEYLQARDGQTALELLAQRSIDLVVLDQRFDRCPPEQLLGDVDQVAHDFFGGDMVRGERYVTENQGAFILEHMRRRELSHPVLFISDFPRRKLRNLQQLHGAVFAVPHFDAQAIRRSIGTILEGAGHDPA
jgi:CheY-like chemotaxis protein